MRQHIALAASLCVLSACGSTQQSFDTLNTKALTLFDAQDSQDSTNWATIRDLTGRASYDGVAYFEAHGAAVPQNQQVRGEMSVDVDFDKNLPVIDGTIDNFISQNDQALAGELRFNVQDGTFQPNPTRPIQYNVGLTGTLQAPGTDNIEDIDAVIGGTFLGDRGQFIGGTISDGSGPLMIRGGYVVQD